jgi:hypothetical protein
MSADPLRIWIDVASILSGASVAIAGLVLSYRLRKSDREFEAKQKESERDFQARQNALDYYKPLYGHIAKLHELATAYLRSLDDGRTNLFFVVGKKPKYLKEVSSSDILEGYKESYETFTDFYVRKKFEGYEIFITQALAEALTKFWGKASYFYEHEEIMKLDKEIKEFENLLEKHSPVVL